MQQAREELLEQLGEGYGYVTRLVEKKVELYKLSVAESTASAVSGAITGVILAVVGLIMLLFALITLGFALTQAFDDNGVYGFGAVTLLLLIIFLVVLLLRKTLIVDPTVKKVITKFFEHDGKEV